MEQITKPASENMSFRNYVFVENKVYCMTILGLSWLAFIIFKQFYPYPDFFSDSYSYIIAARLHMDVNIWPIGYSRFLELFHWFTHSAFVLIFFQYLVFSTSALYFYLTITYFFSTSRITRSILCLFLFFNPLLFYTSNYVTSDILFISMSTIWLTLLIWILHRSGPYHIFLQAVLMFIMFTFRYNAMIYPIIATGVILLSKQSTWIKAFGISAAPILIIPFIIWSSNAAKHLTGTSQFPPILGGWQWANNALYMRGFIEEDSNAFPTKETSELDQIARQFFNQSNRPQDQLSGYVANFFIRQPDAPLKQYMKRHYTTNKTQIDYVRAWGKAAVVFDRYGKFLIERHPVAFARYYLLVNSKNYLMPPLEKLEIYNLGDDNIWSTGQQWFDLPNPRLWCISKPLQGNILAAFPVFFLLLHAWYTISIFLFLRRGGLKKTSKVDQYILSTIGVFLILNAAFSIFANIVVIRYQIFPMLIFLTFTMLQMDYVAFFSINKFPKVGQPNFAANQ